jgi:L-ascorbate metabolism protein UlaG (beta-lactamase superfamily)
MAGDDIPGLSGYERTIKRLLHLSRINALLFILLLLGGMYLPSAEAEPASSSGVSMIEPKKTGNQYENWIDTPMFVNASMLSESWKWIKGGDRDRPVGELPVVPLTHESFESRPAEGLTIRWLGHSSVLMEMSGKRVLIDPVLSSRASPIPLFAKRFSKAPLGREELPVIDAVVISHDHYDHLEKETIVALSKKGVVFFVPSGVGADLLDWGVPPPQIRELTWWEKADLGPLSFICVPARHFSGRGLFDRNTTLWSGWIIKSDKKSVYYCGDTGYADHFAVIGAAYGPFDLTMIKIGAYSDTWPYIHLTPEEAVKAHKELKGKIFLPVHWGTFILALHPWDEPVQRAVKAAHLENVRIATPMIGELMDLDKTPPNKAWWEEVK